MKLRTFFTILTAAGPALVVALLYLCLLGHRRDYLGHYAAGYGGTLSAAMLGLAAMPAARFRSLASWRLVSVIMLCILAGGVAEATVFRLAKFDEVDFCNQSLGAVLAGLVASACFGRSKPADAELRAGIAVGIMFLLVGAYFAVT